jgi:hypothetical protein
MERVFTCPGSKADLTTNLNERPLSGLIYRLRNGPSLDAESSDARMSALAGKADARLYGKEVGFRPRLAVH